MQPQSAARAEAGTEASGEGAGVLGDQQEATAKNRSKRQLALNLAIIQQHKKQYTARTETKTKRAKYMNQYWQSQL